MNFYLFYGEDKGILNREIQVLEKKLLVNIEDIIHYDINEIDNIITEAETMSMFSLKKFLVIDATSYLSEKKEIANIKQLEYYFDHFNHNSYLIFISYSSSIDSRRKLVKLINDKGEVRKIEVSSDYLTKYINDYLFSFKYSITNMDVSYFLSRSGNNIDNITNELDKLILYKVNNKIITRDDITLLVEERLDNSILDLVTSIIKNDTDRAISLYNNFIINGMDASQIIGVLSTQIRLLFQVKRLNNQGKSNMEIADILSIKNVYRVKYLLSDSYYYDEKALIKYLSKLAELDKNIKTGKADGNIFLQLFILKKDM